jgi:hypothetical protein
MPIGYPDEIVPEPAKLTLENVCFVENYGRRVRDYDALFGYTSATLRKVIGHGKDALKKLHKRITTE